MLFFHLRWDACGSVTYCKGSIEQIDPIGKYVFQGLLLQCMQ